MKGLELKAEDRAFLENQTRIALRNCGKINPESIDEFIAAGGYRALEKVLREMTPEDVIETIKKSGLAGRRRPKDFRPGLNGMPRASLPERKNI